MTELRLSDDVRFRRQQGDIAEYSGAGVQPSEIREPLGAGYPILDPEAAPNRTGRDTMASAGGIR